MQGFTCVGIDLLETVVGRSIVSTTGLATVLLLVLTLLSCSVFSTQPKLGDAR